MVRKNFPKVQNADTDTLQKWMEEAKGSTEEEKQDDCVAAGMKKKMQLLLLVRNVGREMFKAGIPFINL